MSAVLEEPATVTPQPRKAAVAPSIPLVDLEDGIILHRFTYDEYHAMITHGILAEDARAELLDGLVVDKMPKKRSHVIALERFRRLLAQWLGEAWSIQQQEPVKAGTSAPEPDLAVIRGNAEDYPVDHPGPQDVPFLVEISDTTIRKDGGTKLRIYAAAGFENYWIIDLDNEVIITHARPNPDSEPPSYEDRHTFHRGESVTLELDGQILTIAVADILPPVVE